MSAYDPKRTNSGVWHQPDLSEEREIVLEVPIVCDTTVLHPKDIGGEEVHQLPVTLHALERACEMAGEA